VPLIQLSQVSLAYGHVPLLDHVDLVIEPGERIGLIGRNGTGKSSLLKVIAGDAAPDDGTVWRAPQLKLASVAQEPQFAAAHSVFDAVAEGLGDMSRLLSEYHAATHALTEEGADQDALLHKMHDLQEALDARDGWRLQNRVDSVLTRLKLPSDKPVADLSGGMKKRVALARALVMEPDLLVLDEPTNHLDVDSIEWLEEVLVAFPGSVLFVTHDRRFLDDVAMHIIELDRGRLSRYPGNFTVYQQRKAEALEAEATQDKKFDKFLAQEEVWIRKGVEARRTRNEGRVLRLEALRLERAARRERAGKVELAVSAGERSGQLVAELEKVGKAWDGPDGKNWVVRNLTCRIQRGDKVGLIGANGTGKTTLLKLILGQLEPDEGTVRLGTKQNIAYFDQFRAALDDNATLADTINPGADFVEINGVRKHVISYLGDFLFPAERAKAPVRTLSGGERNRLLLARLFSQPANVLVLDEPTNDLDIETLELLEELLQDYKGTLFIVSHDREFLDNVVTQTIAVEGNGQWREYAGGYSDWHRTKAAVQKAAAEDKAATATSERVEARRQAPKEKLSYKESRELAELPGRIEKLEAEQAQLTKRLADPALYLEQSTREQVASVATMQARIAEIEQELIVVLERWELLEAKAATAR
jgi:ATP-binding cassette subfamily F protein uup